MNFTQWDLIYKQIIKDMGFDQAGDERAASILSQLLYKHKHTIDPAVLSKLIEGECVLVCGNAPALATELKKSDTTGYDVIIAADGATGVLLQQNIQPTIIVTDLDADNIEAEIQASKHGTIVLAHAHGDNIEAITSIVPKLENVIGTTQTKPLHNVYNFAGFTDGDRCVFLAAHYNAASIVLIGFDFEDSSVNEIKKKKLKWAKKLLLILEKSTDITYK
ncbi:MAG: DUF115 domain-containing protein [Methanosarcinales archaeon]|uniref:6-hydroxymethyl-7,8-dihydropterin pyrophosphokinase n=1 Tax=Candidatus Ethanoperedens thermophilum TaxID=2766897 RepID=A0A848DAM8_9EURY|nr:DUF115 domain-containing protein [Candidatus Ethanoperedens thermophilum]